MFGKAPDDRVSSISIAARGGDTQRETMLGGVNVDCHFTQEAKGGDRAKVETLTGVRLLHGSRRNDRNIVVYIRKNIRLWSPGTKTPQRPYSPRDRSIPRG